MGASQHNNNEKMLLRDGSCGTSLILNNHKITYGTRYLAMRRIARLKTLITSRNGYIFFRRMRSLTCASRFEVYEVMELGGGASSREAHSRLYTRTTTISCNIVLRYQSYKEGTHPDEDGDSKLQYNDLLKGRLTFQGGRPTNAYTSKCRLCIVF